MRRSCRPYAAIILSYSAPDGWLVFAPPLRPGAILLIHPNGNEHPGLRLFVKLLDKGRLPRPFRRINDDP